MKSDLASFDNITSSRVPLYKEVVSFAHLTCRFLSKRLHNYNLPDIRVGPYTWGCQFWFSADLPGSGRGCFLTLCRTISVEFLVTQGVQLFCSFHLFLKFLLGSGKSFFKQNLILISILLNITGMTYRELSVSIKYKKCIKQ